MRTLICALLGHKWLDLDYCIIDHETYWFCTRCALNVTEYH